MRKRTVEDYVENVYDLQTEKGRAHTNDLASALQIAPASVTEILQKLDREGYIDYKKYGGALLTEKGERLAKQIKKKHHVLKKFLTLLGVEKKVAEKDACEMEHVLNPSTVDIIIKFVETIDKYRGTPSWLQRYKEYNKIGKIPSYPIETSKTYIRLKKDKKEDK